MGLLDRVADLVAKLFVAAPDHPGRGGMTGETGENSAAGRSDDEEGTDDGVTGKSDDGDV